MHILATATLESRSFAITMQAVARKPTLRSIILPRRPFQAAYRGFSLRLVALPAVHVSGLPRVSSNSSDEEKEMF